MEKGMGYITNAKREMALSAHYNSIRFYKAFHNAAAAEQDDLMNSGGWKSWENPSNQGKLAVFSAVCFLYAREISNKIGNKVRLN